MRRIDHVLLKASSPQELFALASQTLELPVAWPFTDYGGFASGGVWLGDANLEVLGAGSTHGAPRARLRGLALEPAGLESSLKSLNERGVRLGRPSPYRAQDASGARVTLWTTVALPSVSNDALEVFLCEYADDQAPKHMASSAQLRERGGGPLGIVALDAVVCGATDLALARERWEQLLGPCSSESLQANAPHGPAATSVEWRLAAGPTFRLVSAAADELVELVVRVESLERARRFLAARELLEELRSGELILASPVLRGARIRLVQAAPPPSPAADDSADARLSDQR